MSVQKFGKTNALLSSRVTKTKQIHQVVCNRNQTHPRKTGNYHAQHTLMLMWAGEEAGAVRVYGDVWTDGVTKGFMNHRYSQEVGQLAKKNFFLKYKS